MEKFVFLSTLVLLCTKMFSTKEIELDMSRPNVDTMTNIRKEAYDIKPRTSFIHEVVKGIHANQHPPKDKCKHTRLLMLAYANNLEGVGSILRDVTVGLAIAMHSNRTLVWGLDSPLMFELTKEVWANEESRNLVIGSRNFNCSAHGKDVLAGPFNCFFEPLSSCSLADASQDEIKRLSENGYNDSDRLMLVDVRKALALYHPSRSLFRAIMTQGKFSQQDMDGIWKDAGYLWAASISAYAFRLKSNVAKMFAKRAASVLPANGVAFGLHVRHGDIKAKPEIFEYKKVFEFEEFFEGARNLSHTLGRAPHTLFVATDSSEVKSLPSRFEQFNQRTCKATKAISKSSRLNDDDDDDDSYDDDYDDHDDNSYNDIDDIHPVEALTCDGGWHGESVPTLTTLSNKDRYRTPHGSHTVAADGGCVTNPELAPEGRALCTLEREIIDDYYKLESHQAVPRAARLLRVLMESLEDLYLLSLCDALVAQGTSNFSTLAAMLIIARTGVPNPASLLLFLDQALVDSGVMPTAYLHFAHSTEVEENASEDGSHRWLVHMNDFVSGVPHMMSKKFEKRLGFNPWHPKLRVKMVNGLPQLPMEVFDVEQSVWLGLGGVKPTWPGQCSSRRKRDDDPLNYITTCMKNGLEHIKLAHPEAALHCWYTALGAIDRNVARGDIAPATVDAIKNAAEANIKSFMLSRYERLSVVGMSQVLKLSQFKKTKGDAMMIIE